MADPTTEPSESAPPSSVGASRPSATAAQHPPSGIWERIQRHKVMQWTLGYAALAYTLLHTTEMVSDALEWPHLIARILTIVLLLASPVVVLLAWYHGHKAQHRISTGELSLLTVLLLIAAGLLWAFTRTGAHAPAQPQEAGAPAAPSTTSAPAATFAPAAPSAPAASVAVVPFANLTGEPGKEYFSDGMAEELIDELTSVPGLRVPARTSSFAYKGRNVDIRQIAHDLGVASILEGSVRSAGKRVRVTAQLINAQTGYHYWSQTYDRDFGDVFKLEDEISAGIVEALKSTMKAQLPAAVAQTPPTVDSEAHRLYLQAMSTGGTQKFQLLNQAIARDPEFARAYAERARLSFIAAALGSPDPDLVPNAERDADEAIALDPSLPSAQMALGTVNAWRGNWLPADASFRAALRLDPQDAELRNFYAFALLNTVGHLRRAMDQLQTAHQLAPANLGTLANLAEIYLMMGSHTEALRYISLAVAAGASESDNLLAIIRRDAALESGHYADAATYELAILSRVMRTAEASTTVRNVFAAFGEPANRIAAARSLNAWLRNRKPEDMGVVVRLQVISWYVSLGDLDSAFDFANRSLDAFAGSRAIGNGWEMVWSPWMRPFRRDPRFQAFVTRLKLPDYWQRYGPPDECDVKDGKLLCQ